MAFQQEGNQKEKTTIVNNPPDINRSILNLFIVRKAVDVLRDDHGTLACLGKGNASYRRDQTIECS